MECQRDRVKSGVEKKDKEINHDTQVNESGGGDGDGMRKGVTKSE